MSEARQIEPQEIADALWLAHSYEIGRYVLVAGVDGKSAEALKQRARLDAATAAARAATDYAKCFGGSA